MPAVRIIFNICLSHLIFVTRYVSIHDNHKNLLLATTVANPQSYCISEELMP